MEFLSCNASGWCDLALIDGTDLQHLFLLLLFCLCTQERLAKYEGSFSGGYCKIGMIGVAGWNSGTLMPHSRQDLGSIPDSEAFLNGVGTFCPCSAWVSCGLSGNHSIEIKHSNIGPYFTHMSGPS